MSIPILTRPTWCYFSRDSETSKTILIQDDCQGLNQDVPPQGDIQFKLNKNFLCCIDMGMGNRNKKYPKS